MRQIVDEAYRQWMTLPDDWTPQQRETFGQRAGGGRIAEIAQDPGEVVQADADGGMLGPVCGFGDRPLRSGGPHDER